MAVGGVWHRRFSVAATGFLSELRLCSLDEPQDEQQDHRADEGYNDRTDYASADRNPQHASKESANHRANDADDAYIDDQAKPTTFYDLTRQPAGDCSDNKPSNDPVFHPISPSFFLDDVEGSGASPIPRISASSA